MENEQILPQSFQEVDKLISSYFPEREVDEDYPRLQYPTINDIRVEMATEDGHFNNMVALVLSGTVFQPSSFTFNYEELKDDPRGIGMITDPELYLFFNQTDSEIMKISEVECDVNEYQTIESLLAPVPEKVRTKILPINQTLETVGLKPETFWITDSDCVIDYDPMFIEDLEMLERTLKIFGHLETSLMATPEHSIS